MTDRPLDRLLRDLAPRVLARLVRRHGQFDACEDAVQEALAAAARQWPVEGTPNDPAAWLVTVANRRFVDAVRRDRARRDREHRVSVTRPSAITTLDAHHDDAPASGDDTLVLMLMCCHPSLTPSSQIALTLRAVGGLTTAEIARAFLVPEATMAQRISRAKRTIRDAGARFELPPPGQLGTRIGALLHTLYLLFNEGHTASSGDELVRVDLTAEAIRLTRQLRVARPHDGEVAGLLALMLLTDSHRAARTGPTGALVPLAEQDRSSWDRGAIAEGIELITATLARTPPGPYLLQAAIAAVHAEAPTSADTDWPQIVGLYQLLDRVAPSPVVTMNHAAAVAMVDGPAAGLAMLDTLGDGTGLASGHRLVAVRAHLLEMAGATDAARAGYLEAARRTTSTPEQRYLLDRATRLSHRSSPADDGAPRG